MSAKVAAWLSRVKQRAAALPSLPRLFVEAGTVKEAVIGLGRVKRFPVLAA
jgi:hypothetical protein